MVFTPIYLTVFEWIDSSYITISNIYTVQEKISETFEGLMALKMK